MPEWGKTWPEWEKASCDARKPDPKGCALLDVLQFKTKMRDSKQKPMPKMKKRYPIEKLAEVQNAIKEAPAKEAKFIGHTQALNKMQAQIRTLYIKKNYTEADIANLLRKNGIKITISEVKNMLSNKPKKRTKIEPTES